MRTRKHEKHIRLSDDEYEILRRNAKRAGMTDECFIRYIIRGYVLKELPPVDYYGVMRQLSAIGNSINQIAAQANATGFFRAKEYASYNKELHDVLQKLVVAIEQPERTTHE